MIRRIAVATLGALMLLVATDVSAAPIPITNAGFEDPAVVDGLFTANIPGWALSGPGQQGVWNPTTSQIAIVPEGVQIGFSNGGSISQSPGAVLTANTQYNLTVQAGRRIDGCCGTPTFTVELLAGSTTLNSTFVDYSTLTPGAPFITLAVPYIALATDPHLGETLTIRLTSTGAQSDFDNVTLDASTVGSRVPEPSTLLLVGSAALVLAARRRRS